MKALKPFFTSPPGKPLRLQSTGFVFQRITLIILIFYGTFMDFPTWTTTWLDVLFLILSSLYPPRTFVSELNDSPVAEFYFPYVFPFYSPPPSSTTTFSSVFMRIILAKYLLIWIYAFNNYSDLQKQLFWSKQLFWLTLFTHKYFLQKKEKKVC